MSKIKEWILKNKMDVVFITLLSVVIIFQVVEHIRPAPQPAGLITRNEKIKDWKKVKESALVSVESPWREKELGAGYAVSASGDTISLKSFALEVVTFTDFECPFCKETDSAIREISGKDDRLMLRSIIHLPLPGHPFAMDAARALECADSDGQASEMHKILYENQGKFGSRSWGSIANDAQVEDTTAFLQCMKNPKTDSRINAGIALARKLDIPGTPAVVINGELVFPASPARVDSAIARAVKRLRS